MAAVSPRVISSVRRFLFASNDQDIKVNLFFQLKYMKRKHEIFTFFLLILSFIIVTPCLADESPKNIRGVIVGYQFGSYLLVRTTKKQYVFIHTRTSPMNPLPEIVLQKPQEWNFAVKPVANCDVSFHFLRWEFIYPGCGNDYGEEKTQPEPPRIVNPYPKLSFINEAYRKELDAISDETKLPCYDLDLNNTKPSYRERTAAGVVVAEDGTPIPDFEVSVGFANEKRGYIYVKTDQQGRFSIPVFENFAYWIKPGVTFVEGQKQYKATFIPKKTVIPPLTLKLEYDEMSNESVKFEKR